MKKLFALLISALIVTGTIYPGLLLAASAGEYSINYLDTASDPSTSNLASLFTGSFNENGKIAADKSVQYMGDDYNVFANYDDDEFGITLSALAQSYTSQTTTTVTQQSEVHPDVVFIVDMSSSMVKNNIPNNSNMTRAEAVVNAMNSAVAQLMESDPQTRIGVVSFAGTFGAGFNESDGVGEDALYLPLDTYTLPEGSTDFFLYNEKAATKTISVPDAFITLSARANNTNALWLYPETGTHSNEEYTSRTRIKVLSDGSYSYYEEGSTTPVTGTLSDEQKVNLGSKYTLLRVGNYYYVFDRTKSATTTTITGIEGERIPFTTAGGDTFYAACLDGSSIRIYTDPSSSKPIITLTASAPTNGFTADDCYYEFNRVSATEFTVSSDGVADVLQTFSVNADEPEAIGTIGGKTFYALSAEGTIRFYESGDLDFPVAIVSESIPSASYLSSDNIYYSFAWNDDCSATVNYQTLESQTISNLSATSQTFSIGGETYCAYTSNSYTYICRNSAPTTPICKLGKGSNAVYSNDSDVQNGVFFTRLSDTSFTASYPSGAAAETINLVADVSKDEITFTETNTVFYISTLNGTHSIFATEDSTNDLAHVSSGTTSSTFTFGGTTYTLRYVDGGTISLSVPSSESQSVTDTVTGISSDTNNKTPYTVAGYTYYLRNSSSRVYIYKTDGTTQLARIGGSTTTYTDTSTGVVFTCTDGATLHVEYADNSAITEEFSFGRKTITFNDSETFYISSFDGSINIYTQETGGTALASVSSETPVATFVYNNVEHTIMRLSDSDIAISIPDGEPQTITDTVTGISSDTNNKTPYEAAGYTYYLRNSSSRVYIYRTDGTTQLARIGGSTTTYTDTAIGVTFTCTDGATLQVSYTGQPKHSEPFTISGDRIPVTTEDGLNFYVEIKTNGFDIYTMATGGSSIASISSTNTSATATVAGKTETFTYVDSTHFTASNPSLGGTTVTVKEQGKTECVLDTGDTIHLIVADGAIKIYNSSDVLLKTVEPTKTASFSIGSNQYHVQNIGNKSLKVVSQESADKETISVSELPVKQSYTINGQTFYITSIGGDSDKTFKIYDAADAVEPIAVSTDSTFTYNSVEYAIRKVNDTSIEIDTLTSRNASATSTMLMTVPTTETETLNGTALPTGSTPDQSMAYHSLGINANMTNSNGELAGKHTAMGFEKGTYTQIGLKGAMDMFLDVEDTENRVPVIVLVSDGEPTRSYSDYHNPALIFNGGSSNGPSADDCYLAVRTAIYSKKIIDEHYSGTDAMFYSIGPGVTSVVGQAVLYPNGTDGDSSATYLEKCSEESADTVAKYFYDKLMYAVANDPEVNIDYVNFCDWGLVGDLSEADLLSGFETIVQKINDIPRPITAVTIIDNATNTQVFDGKNMVFTDTIGTDMGLTFVNTDNTIDMSPMSSEVPKLIYCDDNTVYNPTGVVMTSIKDKNDAVVGKKYTFTYGYVKQEPSTGMEKDLSEIEVNVYVYNTGKQRVEWKIPADLVPAIYPDADTNTFKTTSPIRLVYRVHLLTEETGTYYTNSTSEPATCTFVPSKGNSYYYNTELDAAGQAVSNFIYEGENVFTGVDDNQNKEQNNTGTADCAWNIVTDEAGGYGVVIQSLGNNGKISIKASKIAPDSVVIDFGLPVQVNVVANDGFAGRVTGISTIAVDGTIYDTECYKDSRLSGDNIATETGMEIITANGKASFTDSLVIYTPTTMSMPTEQVIIYEFTSNSDPTDKYYSTVTIIPATSIYYEDSFVTFNGEDADGNSKWETCGELISDAIQNEDRPGAADANNYGYDGEYLTSNTYSLGQSHKTTVSSKANNAKYTTNAEFTFTGNAFDVISVTSGETGAVMCNVYQITDGVETVYDKWIVDCYYGYNFEEDQVVKNTWQYSNGAWHRTSQETVATVGDDGVDELPANPQQGDQAILYSKSWVAEDRGTLYQIPIIKSPVMEYGTYRIVLAPIYSRFFDHTGTGTYSFYLDAIRIYSPADPDNMTTTISSAYESDNEYDPYFLELKNVVTAGEYTDSEASGILFLDGYTTTTLGDEDSFEIYTQYGPNNEVYLAPNQSFAFIIEDENADNIESVQLAARIFEDADGNGPQSSQFTVKTIKTLNEKTVTLPSDDDVYQTATDLYYDITDAVTFRNGKSGVILITNTGSSTISFTNLKLTHKKVQPVMMMAAPRLMMTSVAAVSAIETANEDYISRMSVETTEVVESKAAPTFEQVRKPSDDTDDTDDVDDPIIPDEPDDDQNKSVFQIIFETINRIVQFIISLIIALLSIFGLVG